MAVSVIVGNIGSGKTLFMTCIGTLGYFSGYSIYANYILTKIPYMSMDKVSSFSNIATDNNLFLMDELWLTADSRKTMSFLGSFSSQKILQSRKTGHSSHVFITSQNLDQLDKRIRNITSMVFEPEIIKTDDAGKPLIMKIEYMLMDAEKKKIKSFYMPTYINGIDIPNSYNTLEIVDEIGNDSIANEQQKLIKKYMNVELDKVGKLSSYIRIKEAHETNHILSQSEASLIANYILTLRELDEIDETTSI